MLYCIRVCHRQCKDYSRRQNICGRVDQHCGRLRCTFWTAIFRMKAVCFPAFVATSRADKYHFFYCLLNAFYTLELLRTGQVIVAQSRTSTVAVPKSDTRNTSTHLDVNAAPVKPIFTVIALDHERVVILAPADAVRFECLRQSGHKFTICEVNFDLVCLLFQAFQYLRAAST